MEEVAVDIISYNSTISACEKGGRWEVACMLLNQMASVQMLADVISFNSAFLACYQCGQWQSAMDILYLMAWCGCRDGMGLA